MLKQDLALLFVLIFFLPSPQLPAVAQLPIGKPGRGEGTGPPLPPGCDAPGGHRHLVPLGPVCIARSILNRNDASIFLAL